MAKTVRVKNAAARELAEHVLASPANIGPAFRADDFGLGGKRRELLALAHRHTLTLPEFSKSIFAAALHWYINSPATALDDGITPTKLAEVAGALFALESLQRSDPPIRAGYHYRVLIMSGLRDALWWEPALQAGCGNAVRLPHPVLVAEAMSFVARHAAPPSPSGALAFEQLTRLLEAFTEPSTAPDDENGYHASFLVARTHGFSDDNALTAELVIRARAAYWKRADRCCAENEHEQFVTLVISGILTGDEALSQGSMDVLCQQYPRLLGASVAAAERAAALLHRRYDGGRAALVAACLACIDPLLAAADPAAAARARKARNRDEWWY